MKKKFNSGEAMIIVIPIFIIVFWIAAIFGGVYLFFHPELIGEYFGKIMNGFK